MKRSPMPARITPMRRTNSLAAGSSLQRSPIRPVSKKRGREMRVYAVMRRDFLEARPQCEFPLGCDRPATDVHHTRGRSGDRLLDVAWWAASCRAHNQFAETHTGEALAMGWLHRIEGVA